MYGGTQQPAPPSGAVVAAVDIGGTKIDVALADRDGALLERRRLETRAVEGPTAAVARITAVIEELRSEHVPSGYVSAAGVVCAGVVQEDRILLAPNLPGW